MDSVQINISILSDQTCHLVTHVFLEIIVIKISPCPQVHHWSWFVQSLIPGEVRSKIQFLVHCVVISTHKMHTWTPYPWSHWHELFWFYPSLPWSFQTFQDIFLWLECSSEHFSVFPSSFSSMLLHLFAEYSKLQLLHHRIDFLNLILIWSFWDVVWKFVWKCSCCKSNIFYYISRDVTLSSVRVLLMS